MSYQPDTRGNAVNKRFKRMLDDKKWIDIKFTVGEEPNLNVFEAHRNIISSASPVFEAMCFGALAEHKKPVPIPDITSETFKIMLQFIYTDSISLNSVEMACATMYAAEKYMMDNLISECSKYLVSNIRADNVNYVLEHCHKLQSGNMRVVEKCMEHIHAALLRPEFTHVSKETVDLIVDQEILNIPSEAVLLDACVSWAEQQCKKEGTVPNTDNLKAVLGLVVRKLRFQSMTAQELVGSAGFHKLLTTDEAYNIVANAVRPGTFPVPENFSISTKKRAKEEDLASVSFKCQEIPSFDARQIPTTTAQSCFTSFGQASKCPKWK